MAIIEQMMAKDPGQRYATPQDVADALAPWTQTPIPPPPENEMPQLSPAALGVPPADPTAAATRGSRHQPAAPGRSTSRPPPPETPARPPRVACPRPRLAAPRRRLRRLPARPPGPWRAPVAKVLSGLSSTSTGPLRQPTAALLDQRPLGERRASGPSSGRQIRCGRDPREDPDFGADRRGGAQLGPHRPRHRRSQGPEQDREAAALRLGQIARSGCVLRQEQRGLGPARRPGVSGSSSASARCCWCWPWVLPWP